jgi:lysylphosphatidylglycerol synthetase-like protein (DUF2156 family)
MPVPPERPLSSDRAWACVMQNIATPGIGSLKAGRIFAGIGQLLLAVASCFLVCAWVVGWSRRIYQVQLDETVSQTSSGWLLKGGVVCFGLSWLWAMFTCASLIWRAKADEKKMRQNLPPRLSDLTGKPPKLS